jgi:hypothetical protein
MLVKHRPVKTADEVHREYVQAMRALFLVVAVGLAGCSSQAGRFTHTSPNQFIMFDNKTAQACWAGPVSRDSLELIQLDMNDVARAAGEEIRRIEKSEGHAAATQRLLQILFKKPNT